MRSKPLEKEVQRFAVAYLESLGIYVARNNSRVIPLPRKGGTGLYRAGLGKGSADLIGSIPARLTGCGIARFFAAEVKRDGEVPRPDQYDWLEARNADGGLAIWFDSPEMLQTIMASALRRPPRDPAVISFDREKHVVRIGHRDIGKGFPAAVDFAIDE